jgi:hypothetical protein
VGADDLAVAVVDETVAVVGTPELALSPVWEAEIGTPNTSVVAAGKVLICAAGTVTIFTATPSDSAVFVFIHRHVGV